MQDKIFIKRNKPLEVTISFNLITFSCCSFFRILISRIAVIGNCVTQKKFPIAISIQQSWIHHVKVNRFTAKMQACGKKPEQQSSQSILSPFACINYTKKSETFCRHLPNPRRKGSFHYLTLLKPNLINKSTKTIANMAITDQTDPKNAQRRWMPYPFFFIIHTYFLQCYNFPSCFFSCHVHLPAHTRRHGIYP